MEIYDIVNEINESYIASGLLENKDRFLSNLEMMVDNHLGYKIKGNDYDLYLRVSLQESSIAFLYMMKKDKSLKKFLIEKEKTEFDDPILSVNKKLAKMFYNKPTDGLYVVELGHNTFMALRVSSINAHENEHEIFFVGNRWYKEKGKYLKYKKLFSDEIDRIQYESIKYTDGRRTKEITFKPFEKMVFKGKDEALTYIDNWVKSIPKFYELHVPCKLSILLYGEPGTGKTTFSQALAKHLGITTVTNICPAYFAADNPPYIGRDTVLVLDDIDSFTFSREDSKSSIESNGILSKMLDFLDNPPSFNYKTSDGKIYPVSIVVASTNYIDKMDDALKRYGRFDYQIEMSNLPEKEADELCHTYGLSLYDIINKKDINKDSLFSPAKLQALCLSNLDKQLKELKED